MKPYHQTLEEILGKLSTVEADWKDARAKAVIAALNAFLKQDAYASADFLNLFEDDFQSAIVVARLFLDLGKDEFELALRAELEGKSTGVTTFKADPSGFIAALGRMELYTRAAEVANAPLMWQSVLIERLKSGRGSAIKGQQRGKWLEDFAEEIVKRVFGEDAYDVRCRFRGATGLSTEKADFAIPDKEHPRILIESKAYGSTGSKQTDILGDVTRIIDEKRHDTALLLVTDGIAWRARQNDLRKLLEMQNHGRITRIYTVAMIGDLESDLAQLKTEQGL